MEIEENVLDQIRSRPRFKIITETNREDYVLFLKKFLAEKTDEFSGTVNNETATITVKTNHNEFWKPNLALRTETDSDPNKTVIRGIFGPSSAVWTFFMFLYFIFGVLWMVFITIWYVEKQIKSSEFPWAFSLSLFMLMCILVTYLATKFGQKKARNEMNKLREFAEESILKFEKQN